MSKKLRVLDFRFAVGEPGLPQSNVWHAWSNRSDVYVAYRSTGHIHKMSFHPSPHGYCYYGITGEYARKNTGGRRDLLRWKRALMSPAGAGQAARVVWAAFPTDYLGSGTSEIGGVHWIPAAAKGGAIQIDLIFTMEPQEAVDALFVNNGLHLEAYVALPNGEAFAIVSSTMVGWENRDLWLKGGPDFRNVGFRAADEKGSDRSQSISFIPKPNDGDALHLIEMHGNHLKGGEVFGPNYWTIEGTPTFTSGTKGIRACQEFQA